MICLYNQKFACKVMFIYINEQTCRDSEQWDGYFLFLTNVDSRSATTRITRSINLDEVYGKRLDTSSRPYDLIRT